MSSPVRPDIPQPRASSGSGAFAFEETSMYLFIKCRPSEAEAVSNAKAAEGYDLFQAVRESTYRWTLIFKRADGQASA